MVPTKGSLQLSIECYVLSIFHNFHLILTAAIFKEDIVRVILDMRR